MKSDDVKRAARAASEETVAGMRISSGDETPASTGGSERAESHLHFRVATFLPEVGFLVGGWIADHGDQTKSVLAGPAPGIDLRSIAIGSATKRDTAPGGGFRFYGLAPGALGTGGMPVFVRGGSGDDAGTTVRETGDAAALQTFLREEPLGDVLESLSKLIESFYQVAGGERRLPQEIRLLIDEAFLQVEAADDASSTLGLPVKGFVDAAERGDGQGIALRGWLAHDAADRVNSIALVSAFGRREELKLPLPATRRADVITSVAAEIATGAADCGFVAYADIPGLHREDQCWWLEVRMESGAFRRIPFRLGPEVAPKRAIENLVLWGGDHVVDYLDMFKNALAVPLRRFWGRSLAGRPEPLITAYGDVRDSAEVSVIVPLYGRIDFLRHQIANFSNDPDFIGRGAKVELIYVLDDPRARGDLTQLARLVHMTYGVPFRIVDLRANYGYSTANNAGAAEAIGKRLVLLNSDVMPKRSGWASRLSEIYAADVGSGILGCRLLYEDGSLQHAGMAFRRSVEMNDAWINDHPGKGLPVTFDPHRATEQVAAVTGACLMIDRKVYQELGGLSDMFVFGDFEDSDLCLKARAAGHRTFYTPEVELYHLERQSMSLLGEGRGDWRHTLTLFNMWQHSERWRAEIESVASA